MSFDIVTEPIDRWPLADSARSYPQFKSGYQDTMVLLRRELGMLNAKGPVVLQVVTRNGAADIRRDGLLRADAKIQHPGVRLSFESTYGPLTYATDQFEGTYQRPGWQQNLRAIALGLEALRKVDRYGISRSGEQYRGWRAIEAPRPGLDDAEQVLAKYAATGDDHSLVTDRQTLWRRARAASHPDRNGGDRTAWDAVEEAARILGLAS